ncbi:PucR family transcriptional regulator [Nocardiopsis composta]
MRADDRRSIPLQSLLDRRDLGLRPIVMPPGPGPWIRWAAVSELRDPAPYLDGGELVLTAGVNMSTSADELERFVRVLVRAGAGALGFGVTPVFDEVPAALVQRCGEHGLALVEVARETPFVAVGRAVGELLEARHVEAMRRLSEAHRALVRSVTAPAPAERVLGTLSGALDCWAVLLGGSGSDETVHAGAHPPLRGEVSELAARLREPRGPRSAKSRLGGDEVFLHAVGERSRGVLVVGRPDALTATDRAVLGTAVALLGLLSRDGDGRSAAGPLLCRLLLDGGPPPGTDLAPLVAEALAEPEQGEGGDGTVPGFRVLCAARSARRRPACAAEAAALLGSEVVEVDRDRLRAVVGGAGGQEARADLLDALHKRGWLGALSRAVPPEELAAAAREAEALLVRDRAAARTLLARERADPFDALFPEAAARDAAERVLGALAADTPDAAVLRATLHAWLARNGNWDRTAADLGAHRNSVRYRIGRIERDLGIDLSDPEQRMRMWFALTRR